MSRITINKVTLWLNYLLKILFVTMVAASVIYTGIYIRLYLDLDWQHFRTEFVFLGLWAALVFLFFRTRPKVGFKIRFGAVFLVGLCLRVLWFLNIDSLPVSDFGMMFYSGGRFIQGEVDMFHGINYFARFPHMTPTVMYFGLMQYLFADALNATRLINIGLSLANMILLYFIARQLFRDREKSLVVMFIAAVFPPLIYYNNVFASENIAMPLSLLSVLFFLRAAKDKSLLRFTGAGIFLSLAHLFRPVGYIVIVAFVIYALLYYHNTIKAGLAAAAVVITAAILPFALVGMLLVQTGMTQYPLWHGTEPLTVSVLKGTNIAAGGKWNAEDAAVFEKFNGDYDAVDAECKRLIKERFRETPAHVWVAFYIGKYGRQWSSGDFAGAYWAEAGRSDERAQQDYAHGRHAHNKMIISMYEQAFLFNQVIWIALAALSLGGLFRKEAVTERPRQLLYILFCGFALFYLITESQVRYSYIACWIFPLLAATAFNSTDKAGGAELPEGP